jgi:hypothetical protein
MGSPSSESIPFMDGCVYSTDPSAVRPPLKTVTSLSEPSTLVQTTLPEGQQHRHCKPLPLQKHSLSGKTQQIAFTVIIPQDSSEERGTQYGQQQQQEHAETNAESVLVWSREHGQRKHQKTIDIKRENTASTKNMIA